MLFIEIWNCRVTSPVYGEREKTTREERLNRVGRPKKRSVKMKQKLKTARRQHRICQSLLGMLAVVGFVVFMVTVSLAEGRHGGTDEPTIPQGVSLTSWTENGRGGQYVLQVLDGAPPAAGVKVLGTVISDTVCAPDDQGFNHCHNVIEFADRSQITVINTHVMRLHRCLKPGDNVWLSRIDSSWVVAKLH